MPSSSPSSAKTGRRKIGNLAKDSEASNSNINDNNNNNKNNNNNNTTSRATEDVLLRRKQRKKRRRPLSSNNNTIHSNHLSLSGSASHNGNSSLNNANSNAKNLDLSSLSPYSYSSSPSGKKPTYLNDPFHIVSMAIDHDENKRNAQDILQVPLETGKLYHNDKLFFRALDHIVKESRSFRLGYSKPLPPLPNNNADRKTDEDNGEDKDKDKDKDNGSKAKEQKPSPRTIALTPIILSGLLTKLDSNNFTTLKQYLANPKGGSKYTCSVSRNYSNQALSSSVGGSSSQATSTAVTTATTTTSAELVNYTVRMRRAAMSRARLRMKRERTLKIAKPICAFLAVLGLYWYAWSSFQRVLIGFYGLTMTTQTTATITVDNTRVAHDGNNNNETTGIPILQAVQSQTPKKINDRPQRLITSSCRSSSSRANVLNDYAAACRVAEAGTFELLTSSHNHRHTKLFSRAVSHVVASAATATSNDETHSTINTVSNLGDEENRKKLALTLMQYDDTYHDDIELPLYAMHTPLVDEESSMIPLEDIIHNINKKQQREQRQRQRWKRRRRSHKKYKQQQQQLQRNHQKEDGRKTDDRKNHEDYAAYESLSLAVHFWGDTTVNRVMREAIVDAHYQTLSEISPTKTNKKNQKKSERNNNNKEMKILDVGSGLSGTLFSLCSPEFPFSNWSYHGITISQPEVRRATQLIDTAVRPILSPLSSTGRTTNDGNPIKDSYDGLTSPNSVPLTNITIQQASFDDPFLPEEYTTMIAIESLAHSNNITRTLINLANSLEPKGTLIVIEDVVAPWAVTSRKNEKDGEYNKDDDNHRSDYVQTMANLSAKPSLITHEEWLKSFSAAGLALHRPPRDLMLEFDSWPIDSTRSATATAVTGLPFISLLLGDRPWYSTGHGLLKNLIDWFGSGLSSVDGSSSVDDDGNIANRALLLMEDMLQNDRGNAYRKALHNRGDLGYYMYVCIKR
uniref:Methyltransferase type 12 domain-containing protein n=1 Tax=Pseudo-nitzschia australis TaxID=44445 RepID=A0A7S4AMJ6_9STRA